MVKCILKKGGYGIAMLNGVAMVVFLSFCMVFKQFSELPVSKGFYAILSSLCSIYSFSGTVVGRAGIHHY